MIYLPFIEVTAEEVRDERFNTDCGMHQAHQKVYLRKYIAWAEEVNEMLNSYRHDETVRTERSIRGE